MDNAVFAVQMAVAAFLGIYSAETNKPFWLCIVVNLVFALILHGSIFLRS